MEIQRTEPLNPNIGDIKREIKFSLGKKDLFLLFFYQNVSNQVLFFLSCIALVNAYFFWYPNIIKDDVFMISLLFSRMIFDWFGMLFLIICIFYIYRIATDKRKDLHKNITIKFGQNGILLSNKEENHSFMNRHVNAIKSTWTSFLIETDSVPRMIIPKRDLDSKDMEFIKAFAGSDKKYGSSYKLIIIAVLFLVGSLYYNIGKNYKYYYVDQSSYPFQAKWNDSTLFLVTGKNIRPYYNSYSRIISTDTDLDEDDPGRIEEQVVWVFVKGEMKRIDMPRSGTFLDDDGKTYWMAYDRENEKEELSRWDEQTMTFVKEPASLIKEIRKKKRAEWKKMMAENKEVEEPEESPEEVKSISEYDLLKPNKPQGEQVIVVGEDRYTLSVVKKIYGRRENSGNYKLSVKWNGGSSSRDFEIYNYLEGESRVDEDSYKALIVKAKPF